MDKTTRKAARAAALEARPDAGIFALHLGEAVFVGSTPGLAAAQRRLDFMLRTGGASNPALKAAHAAAGTARFEVLERLDTELGRMTRERLLKERSALWRDRLGAAQV